MIKKMAPLPPEQRTVYRLLLAAEETWGTRPALYQPRGGGQYDIYNWVDLRQAAEEVAAGLRSLGIGPGDIVGLASETRVEFYLADVGVMTNGSVGAAVYTSLSAAEQARTLRNCEPKLIFAESAKTMAALKAAGCDELNVPWVVMTGEAGDALSLARLRERGQQALVEDPWMQNRFLTEVGPENYAILYLTSGATGEPKMGLVTHNAIIANIDMGPPVLDLTCEDVTMAFLPSANITQRVVMELLMIRYGTQVYFSEGLTKLPKELQAVKPTFFVAPPRVWERIYSTVSTELRKKPAAVRKLAYLGIGVGSEAARKRAAGKEPSPFVKSTLRFFDRLVFSKIRQRLGGRLRIAVSGAAPLSKDLAEFYAAIGLPLVEGYGLTEGGVVILNPVHRPRAGSIGKPFAGVELRLAPDGELLIKSPSLFSGYYKDPESTAQVLKDGWLYTGDIAEIDREGFVYITGRKKELIVSSNGKKIYPARIEGLFKLEPIINQVFLVGDKLPFMTAIITLNPQAVEQVTGAPGRPLAEMAADKAVQAEVKKAIVRVNKHLASFEQIRKFKVLDREFTLEAGELTPTMKLRRGKVMENCRAEISALYAGREEFRD